MNRTRSDERSTRSIAGDSSIMTNWVLTQARTVTRSRSASCSARSGEKRGMRTTGAPRIVGVKCAVHSPKPNGAGIAERNTSFGVSAPASTASPWK